MNQLKSILTAAIRNPKTTVAGISAIVLGVHQITAHNTEAGLTGILSGLGLLVSVDASEPKKDEENEQHHDG